MSKTVPALAGLAVAVLLVAGCSMGLSSPVPAPTAADAAWRLPANPPMPVNNISTPDRAALGKALFFDQRLSGSGTMACASCHLPELGWTDGKKFSVLPNGEVLGRHSPTVLNHAYNTQFMWDGRKKDLEDQAIGPHRHLSKDAYATSAARLREVKGYQVMFAKAYPGEPINEHTIARALAAFERTIVSSDSPFDHWVAGDTTALTPAQYRGYQVFMDPGKGNCAACHNGPNFTDNGFHNIGIRDARAKPDVGRFEFRPLASMKGAFKTPTLRDIALHAPYFHDGSATTLREVVEHYVRGGDDRSNVSPDVKPANLSGEERDELVAFLQSLTGKHETFVPPALPQ